MKNTKISLSAYDNLFADEHLTDSAPMNSGEQIMYIDTDKLIPYNNQPFKVLDDESMTELEESVSENGIMSPITVRPLPDGKFEILSGHRRTHVADKLGLAEVPAIVKELDDEDAAVLLVDSNLHREKILPSEKAFAYKLKLDALKDKAHRSPDNKYNSRQMLAVMSKESSVQIQRYLRLTNLIAPLLNAVDEGSLAMNAAVELSYLPKHEQELVHGVMTELKLSPSIAQASSLRRTDQSFGIDEETVREILTEKSAKKEKLTFKPDKLKKYFPESFGAKEMEETIIQLLEEWSAARNE